MALLRGRELLAKTGGVTEEPYASRVFNDLEGILSQTGAKLTQIELFTVVSGPGSFTGLRVGLAAVKGWAGVFERPIAAVSALEAVTAESERDGILVPVIDARGGQVFVAI